MLQLESERENLYLGIFSNDYTFFWTNHRVPIQKRPHQTSKQSGFLK